MREVSQEFKDAFLSGGQKELRLEWNDNTVTTNDFIESESMFFEQSISESDTLIFGKVNSSIFTVRTYDLTPRRNKTFKAILSAGEYSYTIGYFVCEEDKLTDDRKERVIVGYDKLRYFLEKDATIFYESFFRRNIPKTIKNFRDGFFEYMAIEQQNKTLINDNFILNKVEEEEFSLTGRELLESICEFNGVFGYMDNDNKFRYKELTEEYGVYPKDDLYPSNDLYPKRSASESFSDFSDDGNSYYLGSCVWEEFPAKKINAIRISDRPSIFEDSEYVVGDGRKPYVNTYSLKNSFVINGYEQHFNTSLPDDFDVVLQNLLDYLKTPSFYSGEFRTRGMVWLEMGDWVRVVTRQGSFAFPILHRKLSGISALTDEFACHVKENYNYIPKTKWLALMYKVNGVWEKSDVRYI